LSASIHDLAAGQLNNLEFNLRHAKLIESLTKHGPVFASKTQRYVRKLQR
jgi:hypothetical protein